MARTSLVALLLAAGNVAGRALQAADSQEVLQGEGEADDLTQFAFSTAAWLKEVQNDSVTKPQIVPLQQELFQTKVFRVLVELEYLDK